MADLRAALENLAKAHGRLREFSALPVVTDRDKAGIIQAFEFTFERFWKTFQKAAPEAGLGADSPRQALQAGVRMGYIPIEHEGVWARMLADRNLTSHTYWDDLADAVYARIVAEYLPCFDEALRKLRTSVQ
jgi:nucleotidyltransferase substrate binding protein (TIGR01987 family)